MAAPREHQSRPVGKHIICSKALNILNQVLGAPKLQPPAFQILVLLEIDGEIQSLNALCMRPCLLDFVVLWWIGS